MLHSWEHLATQAGFTFLAVGLGALLAYLFNERLQARLLTRQNQDRLIDALLQLMQEQSEFYAAYWEKDATDQSAPVPVSINLTAKQTHFSSLLDVARTQYKMRNGDEIQKQYDNFCKLVGSPGFGTKTRKADANKSSQIHAAANSIFVLLWKNKA